MDKIEKTDGSVTYVIEVESGEKEYELTYLEDGILIREDTEWGEHTPIAPGQTLEVKDLVKAKYPQAVILDIEEEKGGIEVEIRDGGRQKEVYYKLAAGYIPRTKWNGVSSPPSPRVYSRFLLNCQEAEW